MAEGLSGTEAGKEIAEHAKHSSGHHAPQATRPHRLDRGGGVARAGHAGGGLVGLCGGEVGRRVLGAAGRGRGGEDPTPAGQTSTRGRIGASTPSTFESWFDAYVAGDEHAMALAVRRFRPEFAAAFHAWRSTNPETNPAAPRGPTYICPSTDSRGSRRPRRWRRRQMRRSPQARSPTRPLTSTSESPCSWPACCSWWASARTSRSAGHGTDSSRSALRCSLPPSCNSHSCPVRPPDTGVVARPIGGLPAR